MTRLGIRIDFLKQKWPDLLKMARAGKLQMWPVGWITQYGEGDSFMQLAVREEHRAVEQLALQAAEYDELYRKTKRDARRAGAHRALPHA